MTQNTPIIRCAIYTRDLVEYGPNDLDPKGQYAACRAYIEARKEEGWVVSRTRYHDDTQAGMVLKDRPALERLQTEVTRGALDRLVVYRLGCLTPSMKALSSFMMIMNYGQCALVAADLGLDTSTPHGGQIVSMLTRLTGFEKGMVGERFLLNRQPSDRDVAEVVRIIKTLHANNLRKAAEEAAYEGGEAGVHVRATGLTDRIGATKRHGRKVRTRPRIAIAQVKSPLTGSARKSR